MWIIIMQPVPIKTHFKIHITKSLVNVTDFKTVLRKCKLLEIDVKFLKIKLFPFVSQKADLIKNNWKHARAGVSLLKCFMPDWLLSVQTNASLTSFYISILKFQITYLNCGLVIPFQFQIPIPKYQSILNVKYTSSGL